MNVYLFELRQQWKTALIWTAATILLFAFLQSGVYPIFSDSMIDVEEIFRSMPDVFLNAFGFDISSMSGFGEFFKLTYLYLVLMGAIMAMVLSVSAFSREKRGKCTDFLLTKPYSRRKLFLMKLLEVATQVTASWILIFISSVPLYLQSGEPTEGMHRFLLSVSGIYFTQLMFIGVGSLCGIYVKKVRSVSGIAIAAGFASFILTSMHGITGEEKMRYIAPLKYFNPESVYGSGGFEIRYAAVAGVITVACILAACHGYCKRDAQAV
ncbi:ABC transporter permease [Parasporobacterium paucivorans]|uniref:ABC-2 family transporter protein n=1 Tax=Parasporobacterium paucivorans DSM 15970 TaxID=1122934 RepID=A0A1M6HL80_9FIRM|nr:ABC transporter permease subunit [Parasporobacterium paucivorans]SHJ22919.1 ABC-2 family transporter protein [Parasporobacterium paucivorans DSM 15970]